jgi:hypothetical protein
VKSESRAISIVYEVGAFPAPAVQFAVNPLDVTDVAAVAVGAAGTVVKD